MNDNQWPLRRLLGKTAINGVLGHVTSIVGHVFASLEPALGCSADSEALGFLVRSTTGLRARQ